MPGRSRSRWKSCRREELDELEEGEERPELTTDTFVHPHPRRFSNGLQQSRRASPPTSGCADLDGDRRGCFTPRARARRPPRGRRCGQLPAEPVRPRPNTSLTREEVDRIRLTPREMVALLPVQPASRRGDRGPGSLGVRARPRVDETTLYLEWNARSC